MQVNSGANKGIVDLILRNRASLFELLIVAIILAIGVNIVSDAVPPIVRLSSSARLLVGLALVALAVVYLALKPLRKRTYARAYEAALIYDSHENALVDIPRYEFAEDITHFFQGAFAENAALKAIWDGEPLSSIPEMLWEKQDGEARRPKSMDLVSEAVEYLVLSELSIHLADYFSDGAFAKANLTKLRRVDIPEVLLSNRFLELFSRPMRDRPHFVNYANDENGEEEGPVSVWNEDGTIYEKLEIVLPRKTRISRPKPHTIEIATNRFTVSVEVEFDGVSVNFPRGFATHYLSITDSEDEAYFTRYNQFQVDIVFSIAFHFGALLSPTGWEYYRWIDSFMHSLGQKVSLDEFISKINWETAYTVLMLGSTARLSAR